MAPNTAERLNQIPLRNAKADTREGESARRNLTPRGALIDQARKRAGLEVKQMADLMGISESFLLRGFKDLEHISWQRLQRLPASFHRELITVQAHELDGVDVVTEIRVRRTA